MRCSTSDSAMPAVRSSRAYRRTPVDRRARRGSTCSLNMAFSSCGGPGSSTTMRPLRLRATGRARCRANFRARPRLREPWPGARSLRTWRGPAGGSALRCCCSTAGLRDEFAAQQIGHGLARAGRPRWGRGRRWRSPVRRARARSPKRVAQMRRARRRPRFCASTSMPS